ncbi:MAG: rod-binding protein [Pseudomonadota bacterium]
MSVSNGIPVPIIPPPQVAERAARVPNDPERQLRAAAEELEAAFLSEMLKQARFGEARGAFGGGIGEDQFASFLRDEHARAIVSGGGIGLAQTIFEALVARSEGNT